MGLLSKVDFRALVAEVMTTLPQEFDPYLTNLVVDCEEEPDLETLLAAGLTEEEIKQGDTLFGLYESGIDGGICSDGGISRKKSVSRGSAKNSYPRACAPPRLYRA